MINDMLVVDAVVHAGNVTKENVAEPIRPMADPLIEAVYGLHAMLSPEEHRLAPEEFLRDWSGEELERVLFLESDVDVCDYHSLPLDDFFVDGLVRFEKGVEMQRRSPQRVCLHAAINPLEGLRALEQVEHSIRELGAHGIKIYPARFVQGQTIPVRLDDPEYGIPVIEKAIECGAKCIAVHKYFPVGPTRLSAYGVDDVEIAGAFPQVNFEVLHPGSVRRRDCVAAGALPERLRQPRMDGQPHVHRPAAVRGGARQPDVLGRGGQDHLGSRCDVHPSSAGAGGVPRLSRCPRISSKATASLRLPSRRSGRCSARTTADCMGSMSTS